jgi:hypothetical protein
MNIIFGRTCELDKVNRPCELDEVNRPCELDEVNHVGSPALRAN